MIDFTEIAYDDDTWELFARDFLEEIGFFIESSPDRGADAGKDLLITEELSGNLNKYRFRWLVSCKHYAKSGKSVSEKDEQSILERLEHFNADGFIGFYSTVPSSGLNTRLRELKRMGKIKDFRFFDHKLIENYLIRIGFSYLLMRYFPKAYKSIKPLHLITEEYIPIECGYCGKDLLKKVFKEEGQGIVAYVSDYEEGVEVVKELYFSCKGECDSLLEERMRNKHNSSTAWKDLTDLVIPVEYLRYIMATLNKMNSGNFKYEKVAFEKEKDLIIALSQKVLREMTEQETKRVISLISMPIC